jgi:hypothetical protein
MSDENVTRLIEHLREEAARLEKLWPVAVECQWMAAPRLSGVVAERKGRGERVDPTAGVALDDARLALRTQIARSEALVRESVVNARGVRRGIEIALERYGWTADE